ncbi:MAG: Asp-tRNA(Asn)/Glu-tRNA(Gln) amidotransferase subunit GatB [Candidatus Dojkabacteria bacterium]|nr:Asp-tRNA(Asn)/Glu-tRNA(Gln) amidotransferase subunit GatB [Candidatus Dojkabacteria bacterium]
MNFEPVIGLEIHVQTKTKSKMFCGCSTDYFGSAPNTHTCPVCLGLPGSLPVPNRSAIDIALKVALALDCTINTESKFDRKNYFYPDLPKGYQISQYDQPIGEHGSIRFDVGTETVTAGITRVHQEEDTGKSIHANGETLLDYNKSGMPLVEIVTEPDLHSAAEVVALAKRLRQILRYLDASDADMEKGQMRIEPNISLRKKGSSGLPDYKVEVKNIGSISVLEKVITKEIARQAALLETGETPRQETRGLVDMTGKTVTQRVKETANDYRYFPEPDIPPMMFDPTKIDETRTSLPERPQDKKDRYRSELGLEGDIAETIIADHQTARFFESAVSSEKNPTVITEIAKWYVGEFMKLKKEHSTEKVKPEILRELVHLLEKKIITRTVAKDVLARSFVTGQSPAKIVEIDGLAVASEGTQLDEAIEKVIKDNPKAVEDVKKNPNAVMFLVGQVMKETKGQADAASVRELLERKLSGQS